MAFKKGIDMIKDAPPEEFLCEQIVKELRVAASFINQGLYATALEILMQALFGLKLLIDAGVYDKAKSGDEL